MELKIIHFYPDLMSLYGSYANIAVLKRRLEQMDNTVSVQFVQPGEAVDLSDADFIFMGAGTERAQKAALTDFARYGEAVKAAAEKGTVQFYAGTAMELLGKTITAADGKEYAGIGLADFTSVQGKRRFVEDVYGSTSLYPEALVGFMNKCSVISGVETPLLSSVSLGYGNEGAKTPEGFHQNNVFGSHLTGPLLVKNPLLLEKMIIASYANRGEALPEILPLDHWANHGYDITAKQLALRAQNNA